jgi:hypothetical protein
MPQDRVPAAEQPRCVLYTYTRIWAISNRNQGLYGTRGTAEHSCGSRCVRVGCEFPDVPLRAAGVISIASAG